MWKFEVYEIAILNNLANNGIPNKVGQKCEIIEQIKTPNYDYYIKFEDGSVAMVKEKELDKINKNELIYTLKPNETVLHIPSDTIVRVEKIDYLNKMVEIDFLDGSHQVVSSKSITRVDKRLVADVIPTEEVENSLKHFIKTFFGHYEKRKGFYEIPEQLLERLLTYKYAISEE